MYSIVTILSYTDFDSSGVPVKGSTGINVGTKAPGQVLVFGPCSELDHAKEQRTQGHSVRGMIRRDDHIRKNAQIYTENSEQDQAYLFNSSAFQ